LYHLALLVCHLASDALEFPLTTQPDVLLIAFAKRIALQKSICIGEYMAVPSYFGPAQGDSRQSAIVGVSFPIASEKT